MRDVVKRDRERAHDDSCGGGGGGAGPRRRGLGKVWLVGAGPGDAELLTRKAERLLRDADVVAYDELVSEEILALANPLAERIPVGRRARGCKYHDGRIHPAVAERALAGLMVVRLKGGDPMIFGRGGEEAEELEAVGVPYEFVPGVTAALGAASSQGLSLTYRDVSPLVTFATAHPAKDPADWAQKLASDLPRSGTIVLYMGMGALGTIAEALVAAGRAANTPVLVVSHATLKTERTAAGTLASIAADVAAADLPLPGLVIVGEVVARARSLARTLPAQAPRSETDAASCRPSSVVSARARVR